MIAPRSAAGLVAAGSAGLLGGAFLFQVWGGLAPCTMCLWQRWPHGAAILLGLAALLTPAAWRRPLLALAAVSLLTTAAIGAYHVGVEAKLLPGPTACTGAGGAETIEALTAQILGAAPVRCDEVPWVLLGLSLAGWNVVLSIGLAGLALVSLRPAGNEVPA